MEISARPVNITRLVGSDTVSLTVEITKNGIFHERREIDANILTIESSVRELALRIKEQEEALEAALLATEAGSLIVTV